MSGFIYFIADVGVNDKAAAVESAWLGYAFDGQFAAREVIANGPGGQVGIVVADPTRCELLAYKADKQSWQRIPGSTAWIGFLTDAPPGPGDLIRSEIVPGHSVELADGRHWLIPVAHGKSESDGRLEWNTALPEATGVDDEGHWVSKGVIPRHEKLWQTALAWWDTISQVPKATRDLAGGLKEITFDFAGSNDAALTALATNYRVGMIEVGILGLFNDQVVPQILQALVDWPTVTAWVEKKKGLGGLNVSPGAEASPPDTVQV